MPEKASELNKALNETKPQKKTSRKATKITVLVLSIILCTGVAVFTAALVISHTSSLRASREEYDNLRGLAGDIDMDDNSAGLSALDKEMLQINPDYVAWLRIEGTNIDYPVVRGRDNEKYLDISFNGEESIAGAIFMDFRNSVESSPHIIIYGHNARNGGMFTDLRNFLNPSFIEENRIITLIENDNHINFEIFSARLTDIDDPAYFLDFSSPRNFVRFANLIDAPITATQILTLSTCTRAGNDDARIIIQGHRVFD